MRAAFRKIFLLLFIFLLPLSGHVRATGDTPAPHHLRISLLTCGAGNDIWEVFGHACIRIVDSARTDSFHDAVFNYGTFNFHENDFFLKIIRGKLPYFLSVMPTQAFRNMFESRQRSMYEEELLLTQADKEKLFEYLKTNSLPENREYKYDFLTNNCSSCIRDVFERVYGQRFVLGNAMLAASGSVTYRDISDQYAYRKPLERFGVYVFLGSTMDKKIDNEELMFIPDYLRKAFAGSAIDGRKIAGPVVTMLPEYPRPPAFNEPFLYGSILAMLTMIGLFFPAAKKLGKVMVWVVMMASGLTGCIILFFWLGSDHLCAQNNFNLFWAVPLNLIVLFLPASRRMRYAVMALVLIGISLVLHLFKVQVLPMPDLAPWLLTLVVVHAWIYRQSTVDLRLRRAGI